MSQRPLTFKRKIVNFQKKVKKNCQLKKKSKEKSILFSHRGRGRAQPLQGGHREVQPREPLKGRHRGEEHPAHQGDHRAGKDGVTRGGKVGIT